MFLLNVLLYTDDFTSRKTLALVICHGSGTASSMASVANTLLYAHVFDAFDMPLDSDLTAIMVEVNDYLQHKKQYENLILIVDMGSLTGIAERLRDTENVDMLLVNNASMPLVLHIGGMIKQEFSVDEIKEHLGEVKSEYRIVRKSDKEKAILFTSENGTEAADKMKALFERSIPVHIDLKMISCDYLRLVGDEKRSILEKYDVLFIEGVFDPKIPGSDFINVGEIVSFKAIDKINRIFSEFLSDEELEVFNRNLLKNFSLENLVESLTILNPGPLLNLVEEALGRLMQMIGYRMPEKALISLYIHVCGFIERMVTRTPVMTYHDLERFREEGQEFIRCFMVSFEGITRHYHVEIPESEIAYIYEYIQGNGKMV